MSILDTLHFCLKVNTDDALNSGAMEVLDSLLGHHSSAIRAKAASVIMDLRFDSVQHPGTLNILNLLFKLVELVFGNLTTSIQ